MNDIALNEDDLIHLRQMTTRPQIMVYISLIKCSDNRTVNLLNVIMEISEITFYSPQIIKTVYERLILDDHLRPKQGNDHSLREGEYTIGGSRKWKRSY